MRLFLVIILAFFLIFNATAQMGCSNTTTLTPGSTQCGTNSYSGDFDDASGSPTNPCSSFYNDGEYWFEYTANGQALQLDVTGLTATYSGLFVLDDCPSGSPSCVASHTSGSSTANFTVNTLGLTNGNTYYIVIANWSTPYQTDFCLTATEVAPPTPPTNDDCSGAISLTVNPDQNCGVTTSGTVQIASGSTDPSSETCGGTADDDVWYSFVATGTQHSVSLLNITGSTTDMYHAVFEEGMGGCPTLGIEIRCSDLNTSSLTGLIVGVTYYVRVYTWTSSSGQTSSFDICIGTPPPPPTNDECINAITLTVNTDQNCGSVTPGYVESASGSTDPSSETCSGTADDDVWYSFVATGSEHRVSLVNIAGSTSDMYHSVFAEGMGCPALGTQIICNDGNTSDLTGLTAGTTYYVRVYTWTSTTGQTSTFNICVGTPPPPTCSDGILNQDEVYTDCGGTICDACPPMYVPTACSSTSYNLSSLDYIAFYDDGGPGGEPCTSGNVVDGSYCNCNCFTTVTICGASGEYIVADFREFSMWNTSTGWDWMKIYDGNSTSGTVLYDNSASGADNTFGDCGIGSAEMEFCSSGQCLTFEFWATSTVNRAGWDALVTSVAQQCVVPNLSVKFEYFNGKGASSGNELRWKTTGEDDHFIVQALRNNQYINIGNVDHKDVLNKSYFFLDRNPFSNTMLYRIVAIDKNGSEEYSKAISVKRNDLIDINLHPNPTTGKLFVSLASTPEIPYHIQIQDVVGKVIRKDEFVDQGNNTHQIDFFDELDKGIYLVTISTSNGIVVFSEKVIKN